jgi:uncharacterized protein (TIGR02284 family)
MADRNERSVLNHLIETCRDEELGLRFVAAHVQESSIKALLLELATERGRFAADLLPHAQRLGGPDAAEGTIRGTLHRRWTAVKEALKGYNDRDMITEAERSEKHALAAYEEALAGMLPPTCHDLVERQSARIRFAHERVRAFLST